MTLPELVKRLRDESDLCANEGATDIVPLLDEAADAIELRERIAELGHAYDSLRAIVGQPIREQEDK